MGRWPANLPLELAAARLRHNNGDAAKNVREQGLANGQDVAEIVRLVRGASQLGEDGGEEMRCDLCSQGCTPMLHLFIGRLSDRPRRSISARERTDKALRSAATASNCLVLMTAGPDAGEVEPRGGSSVLVVMG